MMEGKNFKLVYTLLMCTPGMPVEVNIGSKISRKNLLLLVQVLQAGLAKNEAVLKGLHEVLTQEDLDELHTVASEFLQKGGLTELNDMLRQELGLK